MESILRPQYVKWEFPKGMYWALSYLWCTRMTFHPVYTNLSKAVLFVDDTTIYLSSSDHDELDLLVSSK